MGTADVDSAIVTGVEVEIAIVVGIGAEIELDGVVGKAVLVGVHDVAVVVDVQDSEGADSAIETGVDVERHVGVEIVIDSGIENVGATVVLVDEGATVGLADEGATVGLVDEGANFGLANEGATVEVVDMFVVGSLTWIEVEPKGQHSCCMISFPDMFGEHKGALPHWIGQKPDAFLD